MVFSHPNNSWSQCIQKLNSYVPYFQTIFPDKATPTGILPHRLKNESVHTFKPALAVVTPHNKLARATQSLTIFIDNNEYTIHSMFSL